MKKTILIFVIAILACAGMRAQDIDTLPCGQRQRNYFYNEWYDTADWFFHPDKYGFLITEDNNHLNPMSSYNADPNMVRVFQQYTDNPIRIRGLWALVSQEASGSPEHAFPMYIIDSTRLPEYLYLYVRNPKVPRDSVTWDSTRWLLPVAHARWDTNQPHMICLPRTADGRYGNSYCHLYEAYFDTAVTIQGEFWIGGTINSNVYDLHLGHTLAHFSTIYLGAMSDWLVPHNPYSHYVKGYNGPEGAFYGYFNVRNWYGPFGAITDGQHFVQLSSADTAQGEALYSAFYPDSSYQTITAVPSLGYLFSHWNDSVTDNPRTVFVTQDTAFTAYFRPAPLHSVTVRSSNDFLGYTTGDSTYYEGDPAVIKAIPLDVRYRFTHWNDGDTVNPRTIIVMQDTAFTAHFASPQGITAPDGQLSILNSQFSITPNPTRNSVTVTINPQLPILNSQLSMTLTDAAGRELLNTKVSTLNFQLPLSQYPAGTYFVTLRTPDISSTQRLVIE